MGEAKDLDKVYDYLELDDLIKAGINRQFKRIQESTKEFQERIDEFKEQLEELLDNPMEFFCDEDPVQIMTIFAAERNKLMGVLEAAMDRSAMKDAETFKDEGVRNFAECDTPREVERCILTWLIPKEDLSPDEGPWDASERYELTLVAKKVMKHG